MNIKTTIVLLILVIGGGLAWLFYSLTRPVESASPTLAFLTNELKADKLTGLEIRRGQRSLVLKRLADKEWTLPGKWPVREVEIDNLVNLLTALRSRFAPIPLVEPPALAKYGLDTDPLLVRTTLGQDTFTLTLGEEPGEVNRFSRATFLRLDQNQEVIRLGPGLIAMLDRPQEFFQQRRLFPSERIPKDSDAAEKIERLAAEEITVGTAGGWYKLTKVGDDWELLYQDQDDGAKGKKPVKGLVEPAQPKKPIKDRLDPDKLQTLLTVVPDIWAEQFVDRKDRQLEDLGLERPEQTITVARGKEAVVTLLIGKEAQVKEREVSKPGPPTQFGPPKMIVQKIIEEYRFAKLKDNDQLFEIKADRLKDILVDGKSLRDAQVARFRSEDVRRLEISQQGQQIVLEKEKDRWHLRKPRAQEAEAGQVSELLDKLSGLQAKDKEIIDDPEAKAYGLDKPAVVKVKVEETKGKGESQTIRTRDLTFLLGTKESDKGKVYLQLAGWPRINALDDAVWKLVQRPALAYRSRRVLDGASVDLAKIEVLRGSDTFTLEQVKGQWKLAAPVQAAVDTLKVDQLANELARLDAVEFVAEEAKAEDLDKTYGLAKPALTAKISYSDAKKPGRTLALGKLRAGKDEYFARLDSSPVVFVVRKATFEAINKDSLAFRPLPLWDLKADDIAQLKIHKEDPEYVLKRQDKGWEISGPFSATAVGGQVMAMTEELASLKAEKFVAHSTKDLGQYGLDKPYLRVTVTPAAQKEDKEAPKERVLLVGKTAGKESKARYARLGDGEAVFELSDKVLAAIDRAALDLLDRQLLSLDVKSIQRLRASGSAQFTLQPQKDKEDWLVVDSPAPPFVADADTVQSSLRVWSRLRAEKFAAYGGKINWSAFGLAKPALVVTVTLAMEADKGQSKNVERSLALGQEVKDKPGQRYARLDKEEAVVVLDAALVGNLERSHLDFVDARVLKYDLDTITAILRRMGKEELELVKKGESWQLAKPANNPADAPTVESILEKTFRLRAKKVAAYPAGDLQKFGLDKPAAVVTLKLAGAGGKTTEHIIKIGKVANEPKGKGDADRFVLIDKGEAVVVLNADLAELLVAPALRFRDHNLANVGGIDKAVLERGPRKIVLARVDGAWKVTEPIAAEAEPTELEDFLQDLGRLRAQQLVADKPADLKPYGLLKPQATWKLSAGAKEVLALQVGGEGKQAKGEEPSLFARLGNSDLVFLLSPKLSSQALAEYRNRKPWVTFDAAQVEKVVFGYPTNPFTLQKEDNTWHVVGKPDVKVDSKKVSDTLDALAGLKVLRYVEDHKPDLALYGLPEPALKLDLTTTTGKRTLHIGRPEGDSKRYYATVPTEAQPAVFVLSEADALRIMRNLAAFITKETKEKEKG